MRTKKDLIILNVILQFTLACVLVNLGSALGSESEPNVIIILTDDQGYGELSAHGNPVVKTPNLDRLRAESVRFTDFHVAPMCTPTRGQLMSGQDALRNGAMNVSSGRTLLRRELPIMPQMFADAGYATGIFGKWHLGDTFPYRPEDRGFAEAVWFPSSHIGSVPDYWNNDYFDDTYIHNGQRQAYTGYTTDVLFREAIAWMNQQAEAGSPFLCYLPTAAAHQPHFVPAEFRSAVEKDLERVKDQLPPLKPERERELVRYLAMVANIDENMGRLESFLEQSGQRENTIIVFFTDNGSTFAPEYFDAGMRGKKATLWEGGHRVPCFIRWPAGKLRPSGDVHGLAQVQDLLPTLLELCGVQPPQNARFDGQSLVPVLRGRTELPQDRILVINFSRMPFKSTQTLPDNEAVPRREGAAVLWQRWRLIEDRELYNLETDPQQEDNILAKHPEVVAKMRAHLDTWWAGVRDECREFQPSIIGNARQNPVTLSACEWADVFVDQQAQVRRGVEKNGRWHLDVDRAGRYRFELRRFPPESGLRIDQAVEQTTVADGHLSAGPALLIDAARLQIGHQTVQTMIAPSSQSVTFEMNLSAGRTTLQTWWLDEMGKEICGAYYVIVRYMDEPTST